MKYILSCVTAQNMLKNVSPWRWPPRWLQ